MRKSDGTAARLNSGLLSFDGDQMAGLWRGPLTTTTSNPTCSSRRIQDQARSRPGASKTRRIQDQAHLRPGAFKTRRIQDQAHSRPGAFKTGAFKTGAFKTGAFKTRRAGVPTGIPLWVGPSPLSPHDRHVLRRPRARWQGQGPCPRDPRAWS